MNSSTKREQQRPSPRCRSRAASSTAASATIATSTCGRKPIENDFGCVAASSRANTASQQIIATLAISAGCTWIGPIASQRDAPPALCPKPNAVTQQQRDATAEQRIGERAQAVVVDARQHARIERQARRPRTAPGASRSAGRRRSGCRPRRRWRCRPSPRRTPTSATTAPVRIGVGRTESPWASSRAGDGDSCTAATRTFGSRAVLSASSSCWRDIARVRRPARTRPATRA